MAQLKQSLTLFDMTMIAIGATIGSGIFLTPSIVAQALPVPWLILAVWVVGGLMALSGGLTFAELAAMMPRAGGEYVYLKEAYGSLVGFLFGWAYFVVCNAGGLGALSVAFATYVGYFVPLTPAAVKSIAIAGLFGLTALNVLGVKIGAVFSDVFTILKIAGILALVAIGFSLGSPRTTDFTTGVGAMPGSVWSGLALAMVGVLWSFGGWQHATYASAEIKDPKRTLPRAMIIGTAAVTAHLPGHQPGVPVPDDPVRDGGISAGGRRRRRHGARRGRRPPDLDCHLRLDVRRRGDLHADGASDLLCDGAGRPVLPEGRRDPSAVRDAGGGDCLRSRYGPPS